MIPKLKPYQPDPYIKLATDQEVAKFGHLNWLIGQINQIAVGGIQSVVAGTDISIDNTDPQNPIINYTGGGGGSQDLDQTLFIGDDANQQNIVNLNTLQGGLGILLTITDDNSGGILLNPSGPATLGSVGDLSTFTSGNGFVFAGFGANEIDASTCTKITIPQVVLSAGLVATPSLTFVGQTDMGIYKVSATQMGTSIGGTLVGGWNTNGLFTSQITEQVGGVGVTFPNDIHANTIKDSGGNMVISQEFPTGTLTIGTLDNGLIITSGDSLTLGTNNNSDLAIIIDGTGTLISNGKTGVTGMTLAAAILVGDKILVNGIVCEP